MSINISYSKIYHQARILDTPEEEGVTNMPDRKGWKDDTLKKKMYLGTVERQSSRTFIFLQTMNTYDIGACRQKSNPYSVWSGYTETLYAIFILPCFNNSFLFPTQVSHLNLEIMWWTIKSGFDCILKQNAKGGRWHVLYSKKYHWHRAKSYKYRGA